MQLTDPLSEAFRLNDFHKKALAKLGVKTIEDLLYHFPVRYGTLGEGTTIIEAGANEKVTLYGTVGKIVAKKSWKSKRPMAQGSLTDGTGKVSLTWLHQPYIAKMIPEGSSVKVSGKITERTSGRSMMNPEIEVIPHGSFIPTSPTGLFTDDSSASDPSASGLRLSATGLWPVYAESRGVTSRWFYHALQKILTTTFLDTLDDPIPADILKRYNLPTLKTALLWIHTPKDEKDAKAARKRFAFEEVFLIQLKRQQERAAADALPSWNITDSREHRDIFTKRFPFKPTGAQERSIEAILKDFSSPHAMSRLLEGDVGSGKTFVAAVTAHAVVTSRPDATKDFGNLQVAYMAPTEILATQHFESFIEYFRNLPIQIGLITSSGCKKFPSKVNPNGWTDIPRTQLLKWVANGEIPILIGTHSLIQKSVKFKHLAYVIIDEQHRFGTNQRMALVRRHERTERGQNAEEKPKTSEAEKLLYKDLTYIIRDVLFNVRKELGLGHKEVIYQRALEEGFKKRGLSFNREVRIPVFYQKKQVGIYQPDFVIDDKVILELKSLPFLGPREKKQVWSYLKGSKYSLALLANFGGNDLKIERIIYEGARTTSASGPRESAFIPHLLSMTATPIPRTLALTVYGDLDLTLLNEQPAGRKPIITTLVTPGARKEMYEAIRARVKLGRQAYVICPRIDEPDPAKEMALRAKSVTEEARRLEREVFPEFKLGILHGKMTPTTKEKTMKEFSDGAIDILVATSVVEVGVNVPNATSIIIEGAERFGLSQLHQLRGRVLRSSDQAYCYLLTETKGEMSLKRLKALTQAANGFELAEHDLALRGAGELYGARQWGITDVGMEALQNIKMVEAARNEAQTLVAKDRELSHYPLLAQALASREELHFE